MNAKPSELRNVVGISEQGCRHHQCVDTTRTHHHQQRGGGRLPEYPYWKMTREQQLARRSGDGRGAGRGLKMASGAAAGADMDEESDADEEPSRSGTCQTQRGGSRSLEGLRLSAPSTISAADVRGLG